MLRIPLTARRTNASVWKELDAEPMMESVVREWHISDTLPEDSLKHTVMLGMGEKRGRPRSR